jgi:hypothetical protein
MQAGGLLKGVGKLAAKNADDVARQAAKADVTHPLLQGYYRGYAGENTPARTMQGTETYFVSPQKRVADYYAERRAAETGGAPHAEMILADPGSLRNKPYGLGLPMDQYNRDFVTTRARRIDPDEVKARNQLYAKGGAVSTNPFDHLM